MQSEGNAERDEWNAERGECSIYADRGVQLCVSILQNRQHTASSCILRTYNVRQQGNAVCRVTQMQSEGNAVCRVRVRGMQSEGNAVCRGKGPIMRQHTAESPAYHFVVYITHIQRAATGECSMQSEENTE